MHSTYDVAGMLKVYHVYPILCTYDVVGMLTDSTRYLCRRRHFLVLGGCFPSATCSFVVDCSENDCAADVAEMEVYGGGSPG